jgi:hypothetical protein
MTSGHASRSNRTRALEGPYIGMVAISRFAEHYWNRARGAPRTADDPSRAARGALPQVGRFPAAWRLHKPRFRFARSTLGSSPTLNQTLLVSGPKAGFGRGQQAAYL